MDGDIRLEKLWRAETNAWPGYMSGSGGGIRATHKTLLMLVALRELLEGRQRLMAFSELDTKLRPLLRKYTAAKSVHTEYPFWRLQRDRVWEVPDGSGLTRRASNTDPLRSELLRNNVPGGFTEPICRALQRDAEFRQEFIGAMLRHFPEAHEELLRDVGIQKA